MHLIYEKEYLKNIKKKIQNKIKHLTDELKYIDTMIQKYCDHKKIYQYIESKKSPRYECQICKKKMKKEEMNNKKINKTIYVLII